LKSKKYILYLLKLSDDSYYTGITVDLEKRVEKHKQGKGSKYVCSRLPIKEVYRIDEYSTRSEASKREAQIKRYSHRDKELLTWQISYE